MRSGRRRLIHGNGAAFTYRSEWIVGHSDIGSKRRWGRSRDAGIAPVARFLQ